MTNQDVSDGNVLLDIENKEPCFKSKILTDISSKQIDISSILKTPTHNSMKTDISPFTKREFQVPKTT